MNDTTRTLTVALAAMAAGAAAMYYLDPQMGRRRRAEVGQRVTHLGHLVQHEAQGRTTDLRNRLQGLLAEARGLVNRLRHREEAALPDADDGLEPLSMTPEPLEQPHAARSRLLPALAIAAPVAMAVGAAVLKHRHDEGGWLH